MSISKVLHQIMTKEPNMYARQHLDDAARIVEFSVDPIPEYVAKIEFCLQNAVKRSPQLETDLLEVRQILEGYLARSLPSKPSGTSSEAID